MLIVIFSSIIDLSIVSVLDVITIVIAQRKTLTHSMPLISILTAGFLMFSGGIERDQ